MRLIKNTTELIGIKDQNIIISLVFEKERWSNMTFKKTLKSLFSSKRERQLYYVWKNVVSSVKVVGE